MNQCTPIAERDMAQCEFINGIKNVRGTISTSKTLVNGRMVTRKVIVTCRNGKQRIYIRETNLRSTLPSENELKARERFALAQRFWNGLPDNVRLLYADVAKKTKFTYNGKKYATLRGYVFARYIANDII